jgi:hypothetical protein
MCLAEDWGQKGYELHIHGKEGSAFVSSAAVNCEGKKGCTISMKPDGVDSKFTVWVIRFHMELVDRA